MIKTQQVINVACTGSRNLLELSFSSVTLFFHWSKAKGNGNGGRLSSCLMVWEAASDWSKPYFSSNTHGGKRKLQEVAWSCTHLEENLLITCCVFGKTEKSETCFTVNRGYHQEQHGEDELNDVGTNVVTLDEEVISWYPLSIALHAVLSLFV